MVLIFGILGFLCCFFSIAALSMGLTDLGKMNRGEMDPDGKALTLIGTILGGLFLMMNLGFGILRAMNQ